MSTCKHFQIVEPVVREMDRDKLERFAIASAIAMQQLLDAMGVEGVVTVCPAEIGERAEEIAAMPSEFVRRCRVVEAGMN